VGMGVMQDLNLSVNAHTNQNFRVLERIQGSLHNSCRFDIVMLDRPY
jgi:hypothetical protein